MLSTAVTPSSTTRVSWEYLMPKRRERALLYIRESDLTLALDSTTVESAKNALLAHAAKKNYEVSPDDIHVETISGYHTYYFERPELMKALRKAERHEVDVFLVTEIRAVSRRGAGETAVIYNILQNGNVRLETLTEAFEQTPVGELVLSFRATYARLEREQSYVRMQRGKRDRIEIGNAPPNGRCAYGFILVDNEKETSAEYRFNTTIIHVDANGEEWSEIKVRKYILDEVYNGVTLHAVTRRLNDLLIPAPGKPYKHKDKAYWRVSTVRNMIAQTINYGEVYVNKWKRLPDTGGSGKHNKLVKCPQEEWTRLNCVVPTLISKERHEVIMRKLQDNRSESLRNNQHTDELGLLRSGYIFCGICGTRMSVKYPSSNGTNRGLKPPFYRCIRQGGKAVDVIHNHLTTISMKSIENIVKDKIVEALLHPSQVREQVAEIRKQNRPVISQEEIETAINEIRKKMQNLYRLAENATDDETIAHIAERMNELEGQKREVERLHYVLEDNAEETAAIEEELQKFEAWAEQVKPALSDRAYLDTASYEELRLAIKILGVRVTIYPLSGDYPFRWDVKMTVPGVLGKMNIVSSSRA
ncbi:MAG TPA: recombinase family protein [Ktedonobacteraceae bacterium]|nr:recombinase family protein [Ktedonobacteraceae bacterium]